MHKWRCPVYLNQDESKLDGKDGYNVSVRIGFVAIGEREKKKRSSLGLIGNKGLVGRESTSAVGYLVEEADMYLTYSNPSNSSH